MDASPSPSPRGSIIRANKPKRRPRSSDTTMDTAEARKFSRINYTFDLNKLGIHSSGGRDQFAKVDTSDIDMKTPPERAISPVSSTDPGPEDFTVNMMKYFEGVEVDGHIIPPWDETKDKSGKIEPSASEEAKTETTGQPKPKKKAVPTEIETQPQMQEAINADAVEAASLDHPSEGTIPSPTQAQISASHSNQSSRRTSSQPAFHPDDSFYINDESFTPQDVDSMTYQSHLNYKHPNVEEYASDDGSLLSVHSDLDASPHLPRGPQSHRSTGSSVKSATSVAADRNRTMQSSSPMPWDQPLPEMHPTTQQVLDQIHGLQERVRAFQEEAEEERERSRILEEENIALASERTQLHEELEASKTTFASEKAQLELDLQNEKATNAADKAQLKQDLEAERATNAREIAKLEQDLQAEKAAHESEKGRLEQELGAAKAAHAAEKAQLIRELEEMKSAHDKERAQLEWDLESLRNAYASEKAQLTQDLEATKTQVSSLTVDYQKSKEMVTALNTQLEKSEDDIRDLEAKVSAAKAEKDAVYDDMDAVAEELDGSKANVHKLAAEIHDLKLEATERITTEEHSLEPELKAVKAEWATALSRQRTTEQTILAKEAERKETESQLEESKVEITNIRYTLSKTRSALERTKNALQAKDTASGRDLRDLEKRLKGAWKEREGALLKERELMAKALFREWGKQEVGDQAVEVEYPDGTRKRGNGYRYKY